MNFKYEENEKIMMQYIAECRKQINDTFFDKEELDHHNDMIDIKLDHTMRVVTDVSKMADKMGMNIDFTKVVKTSALLHDIARFNQAVWSNDFNDRNCRQFNGMAHADFGYHILYVNQKIKDFKIPENYHFSILQAVKYHQIPNVTGDLALRFKDVKELDVQKYLTGSSKLNESEKIIVATLVQMVKDVDMLDILYQNMTGKFPVVKDSITYDVEKDSLSDISKYWGISEEEIIKFNGLKS